MKNAADYLAEANAVVPAIDFDAALAKHKAGGTVFIDVRDSGDIAQSGTIASPHSRSAPHAPHPAWLHRVRR